MVYGPCPVRHIVFVNSHIKSKLRPCISLYYGGFTFDIIRTHIVYANVYKGALNTHTAPRAQMKQRLMSCICPLRYHKSCSLLFIQNVLKFFASLVKFLVFLNPIASGSGQYTHPVSKNILPTREDNIQLNKERVLGPLLEEFPKESLEPKKQVTTRISSKKNFLLKTQKYNTTLTVSSFYRF